MDKVKKYQDIVTSFLENYIEETSGGYAVETVKPRVILDRINNSFQLLSVGWSANRYTFSPIFHFDIINEKIWIQCNNTEREIVDELMSQGVDNQDIVLGFIPPHARHLLGFATA